MVGPGGQGPACLPAGGPGAAAAGRAAVGARRDRGRATAGRGQCVAGHSRRLSGAVRPAAVRTRRGRRRRGRARAGAAPAAARGGQLGRPAGRHRRLEVRGPAHRPSAAAVSGRPGPGEARGRRGRRRTGIGLCGYGPGSVAHPPGGSAVGTAGTGRARPDVRGRLRCRRAGRGDGDDTRRHGHVLSGAGVLRLRRAERVRGHGHRSGV